MMDSCEGKEDEKSPVTNGVQTHDLQISRQALGPNRKTTFYTNQDLVPSSPLCTFEPPIRSFLTDFKVSITKLEIPGQ